MKTPSVLRSNAFCWSGAALPVGARRSERLCRYRRRNSRVKLQLVGDGDVTEEQDRPEQFQEFGEVFPMLSDEQLVDLHRSLAWHVMTEEQSNDFADELMETTGPPKPDLTYIRSTFKENPVCKWLRTETFRNLEAEDAWMLTSPEQGAFLSLMITAIGAQRVLDIGTFTGYSSTTMALAGPQVQVTTVDIKDGPELSLAQEAWRRANVLDRVESVIEDGLDYLSKLPPSCMDLVFIDADKERYEEYYKVAKEVTRTGGVIVIDDSLWSGRLGKPEITDYSTQAIREVNQSIADDPTVRSALIPIHDGMTVAVKYSSSAERHAMSPLCSKIVALEGNIAVGKSTLLNMLTTELSETTSVNTSAFFESPMELFLSLFYEDPDRYGFVFQLHMLQACQKLMQNAVSHSKEGGGLSLIDRSPWGNSCFGDCNHRLGRLTLKEFLVYQSILESSPLSLDLIVYLDVSPYLAHERCKLRSNDAESTVDLEYLEELDSSHFEKLVETLLQKNIPVLLIDWQQFGHAREVLKSACEIFEGNRKPASLGQASEVPKEYSEGLVDKEAIRNAVIALSNQETPFPHLADARPIYISRLQRDGGEDYSFFKRVVLHLLANEVDVVLVNS